MKAIYFIILAVLVCVLMGCTTLFPREDEEFSFQRRNYTGTNLRLDGFYYAKWMNDGVEQFYSVRFLYENGIKLGVGGGAPMEQLETYTQKYTKDLNVKDKKGFWGIFKVEGNRIIIESWNATQTGYKVYHGEGIILNDTTFVIKENSNIVNGKKVGIRAVEQTYYFKQFSPKPSSENDFIK